MGACFLLSIYVFQLTDRDSILSMYGTHVYSFVYIFQAIVRLFRYVHIFARMITYCSSDLSHYSNFQRTYHRIKNLPSMVSLNRTFSIGGYVHASPLTFLFTTGLEDLALCSSRSRNKRNSWNRKSSTEDMFSSPPNHRRASPNVSVHSSPSKSRRNSGIEEPKIIVDTQSILDLLKGASDLEEEEEEEEDISVRLANRLSRPRLNGHGMNSKVKSETSLSTMTSPSHIKPLLQQKSTVQKKSSPEEQSPKTVQREKVAEKVTPKQNTEPKVEKFSRTEDKEPATKTTTTKEGSMRDKENGMVKTDTPLSKDKPNHSVVETNKKEDHSQSKGSEEGEGQPILRKKVTRTDSMGSKNRRHMSGDQALGIFHHNRRSQIFDASDLDDAEKRTHREGEPKRSSLKRQPSYQSTEKSPLRDSLSSSPMPHSPTFFISIPEEAKKPANASDATAPPALPSSPSRAVKEDSPEEAISDFQKQLMARKGRVANKAKIMAALTQEESVIRAEVPKVQLIKPAKKEEVIRTHPYCFFHVVKKAIYVHLQCSSS